MTIEEKLDDMVTLTKLDNYMSATLKDADFVALCVDKIGTELSHFIQVDRNFISGQKNFVNFVNFETFYDKEHKQDIFKSLMIFVIDFIEPSTADNVTRHNEKEVVEYIGLYAINSISKNLKELSRGMKLISYNILIPDTDGSDTIECVVPITFGLTHNTLGDCK